MQMMGIRSCRGLSKASVSRAMVAWVYSTVSVSDVVWDSEPEVAVTVRL